MFDRDIRARKKKIEGGRERQKRGSRRGKRGRRRRKDMTIEAKEKIRKERGWKKRGKRGGMSIETIAQQTPLHRSVEENHQSMPLHASTYPSG